MLNSNRNKYKTDTKKKNLPEYSSQMWGLSFSTQVYYLTTNTVK